MQAHSPAGIPSAHTPRLNSGAWRILLGLLQGLFLYGLYRAAEQRVWPATEFQLFVPLVLAALFVPILLVSGLGHMPRRQLVLWGATVALVLAGLGWYDAWRSADLPLPPLTGQAGAGHARIPGLHRSAYPGWPLVWCSAAGLFIAHSLVMAAVRERRRIAAYATHFDVAWTLGVQLAFSALFTGVGWLVLLLGAGLFELVKLKFLTELLHEEWFAIPVTTFAFACAMHLTDMRPAIVRGIRGLLLALMSWLLPVAVLLVGGFLATLPFTGLAPLWGTRHAAGLLLCAAAVFVVLVNAAWQQGDDAGAVARVVRVAARTASLLPVPLVVIAIHALFLRVRDYGWTGERVGAAACMLVAACYAAGYFQAGLRAGWLPSLARVNIAVAFVIVGLLLALFSPLLDPVRISVASQVARLESGKVAADKFDFAFLRFGGERFGRAALDRLERRPPGPDGTLVRRHIAAVDKMENSWDRDGLAPLPDELAANLRVHPAGAGLPASFLRTDWTSKKDNWEYPECLRGTKQRCDAFVLDADGDGRTEVLVTPQAGPGGVVLALDAQGQWIRVADVVYTLAECERLHRELSAGNVRIVEPRLKDLDIGGIRARLVPADTETGCSMVALPR